jgi:hypothetical protein
VALLASDALTKLDVPGALTSHACVRFVAPYEAVSHPPLSVFDAVSVTALVTGAFAAIRALAFAALEDPTPFIHSVLDACTGLPCPWL